MTGKRQRSLKDYNGEDKVISSHEMKLALDQRQEAVIRVKSLFPSLDRYIEDFRDGELIAISGPTKMGKTLLAQTLTVNFAKQGQPSLWFTYELPARQFLSQFPELPMIYMPARLKARALDWLTDRIIESFEKYHTRIVFIDHLHFLFDLSRTKTLLLKSGPLSGVLRELP